MTTVIVKTVTRVVVPIILVVSFALFLQGHNQPGGGFIAGVLTSSAFALIYIAYSLDFLEDDVLGRDVETTIEHIRHGVVADYRWLFGFGLFVAVLSGLAAIGYGYLYTDSGLAFMTQNYTYLHVPLYGEIEVASAVAFDFGVYAVVVGALLTILSVVGAE
ncbi:MnhB domain-containing protein [Halobacterium wangiae]|uniref:MnhB domain-containing protein n=1 Tax=Halobacterium wangiae TaxID=2902623 RepID=UPI001E5AEF67|nr:MnhB domain-containing protein [Halobacterium wangiae]